MSRFIIIRFIAKNSFLIMTIINGVIKGPSGAIKGPSGAMRGHTGAVEGRREPSGPCWGRWPQVYFSPAGIVNHYVL